MVDEGHDFAPEWLKLVAQMVNVSNYSELTHSVGSDKWRAVFAIAYFTGFPTIPN
jgi:hypothetical protein